MIWVILRKIHSDKRGSIHTITDKSLDGKEITIIHTNKDCARGGCINKNSDEHHIVVKGKIYFGIGGKELVLCKKGDTIIAQANTPHYCISVDDSIFIEFGRKVDENTAIDESMRKVVDKINEVV